MWAATGHPLVPIKHAYRVIDQRAETVAEDLPLLSVSILRGVVPRRSMTDKESRAEDLSRYKVCDTGDVIINRMSAFQGAIGIARQRGIVSPEYLVLRATRGTEPRFLSYLIRSGWFVSEMIQRLRGIGSPEQGSVRTPRINPEDLGGIKVALPAEGEQNAIADFLDRGTARIDFLITAKRQMVELLAEARTSRLERIIEEFGLQSTVQIGHTSIEIQTGPFGSQLHADEYVDGGWPVVNPQNLTDSGIVAIPRSTVATTTRDRLSRHALRQGDVVMARRGELGRCAVVGSVEEGWLCGTGCLRLRVRAQDVAPAYLQLALSSQRARYELKRFSVGSTIDNLNSLIVGRLAIPLPPPHVQQTVVDDATKLNRSYRRAVASLELQFALLAERRQALITAAVAGELQIPVVAD